MWGSEIRECRRVGLKYVVRVRSKFEGCRRGGSKICHTGGQKLDVVGGSMGVKRAIFNHKTPFFKEKTSIYGQNMSYGGSVVRWVEIRRCRRGV